MHVFLTGEIQQGKSTIINRLLKATGIAPDGFKTVSGPVSADGSSDVHMIPADGGGALKAENIVFHRRGHHGRGGVEVYDNVFDTLGVSLLKSNGRPLIVMDELGTKEIGAKKFQNAVLTCLDGEIPILGVVQKRKSEFLDQVRRHPSVRMIEVDVQNREEIFEQLFRRGF